MFRLHDNTRRQLCRLGFVLLCVVPVAVVVAASLWLRTGHFNRMQARALSAALDANVSVGSSHQVSPGATRYERVEVCDPETGERLARAATLSVERRGDSVVVLTPQITLYSSQALSRLCTTLERRLRMRDSRMRLRVAAGEVVLQWGGRVQKFAVPEVQLVPNAYGQYLAAHFHDSAADGSSRAKLEVWLDRRHTPHQATYRIETGAAPLPCRLLASLWPPAGRLGGGCTFQGVLLAQEQGDRWKGELAGSFADIDLDALITQQFPHELAGQGRANIQFAEFADSALTRCFGSLEAGPGQISPSLVHAAAKTLGAKASDIDSAGSLIAYDQLGLSFGLDRGVMQIRGNISPHPGAILTAGHDTLLAEPASRVQSVSNLIRVLEPLDQRTPVAASRGAARLVELLTPARAAPETVSSAPDPTRR